MKQAKYFAPAVGVLTVILLSTPSLVAQDTSVTPAGTQVATEQTPVAAASAEELRKQSQNPIANLISVPIQENANFAVQLYVAASQVNQATGKVLMEQRLKQMEEAPSPKK